VESLLGQAGSGKIPGYDKPVSFHIRKGGSMKQAVTTLLAIGVLTTTVGCSGGSLTTREKGAGIGALGGAAAGGLIGAAVGRPGAGAAIGGVLGLGTGALVGDQLQGQDNRQIEQQRQIDANQAELDRQRRELEMIRKQGEY
jgi:phage tail tape-measure protein